MDNKDNIIKTEDGGATWEIFSNIDYDTPSSLIFINKNTGYITATTGLFKTEDGGKTWVKEFSHSFVSLQAMAISKNGQHATVVGSSNYGAGSGIFHRDLLGDWEEVSSYRAKYDYSAIRFFGNLGFSFGDNEARGTQDGGLTWKAITAPKDDKIIQIEMVGDDLFAEGRKNLYKSTDLGETWTTLGSTTYFNKFYFLNEQVIYAGGSEFDGAYRSLDGGVTWSTVYAERFFALGIDPKNDQEGFMAGLDGIIRTKDGGQTWKKVDFPLVNDHSFLYSIHFFNDEIGLAGSKNGIVYRTTDDGATWNKINTLIRGKIRSFYAESATEWYAMDTAGSSSSLFKSMDGGLTWIRLHYFGSDLNNFQVNGDSFYAAGDDDNLYKISKEGNPPLKTRLYQWQADGDRGKR